MDPENLRVGSFMDMTGTDAQSAWAATGRATKEKLGSLVWASRGITNAEGWDPQVGPGRGHLGHMTQPSGQPTARALSSRQGWLVTCCSPWNHLIYKHLGLSNGMLAFCSCRAGTPATEHRGLLTRPAILESSLFRQLPMVWLRAL